MGATAQQALEGVAASPKDVVEKLLLELAGAAVVGLRCSASWSETRPTRRPFFAASATLRPWERWSGRSRSATIRGRINHVATLTHETRERLTASLRRRDEEKPVSLDGVLKSINLRGAEPRIGVDTPEGVRVFRIAKGEHDDTIGPKLNQNVRIVGMRRVNDDGEAAEWADDVLLLEDALREPAA